MMSIRSLFMTPRLTCNLLKKRTFVTKTYLETHEWLIHNDDHVKLGLSAEAINLMNDIVYIEDNVDYDQVYEKGDPICIIESVKAVSEMYSPVRSQIIEINQDILDNLDELNKNPENEDNWILKLKNVE